jgi:hypothetical protein
MICNNKAEQNSHSKLHVVTDGFKPMQRSPTIGLRFLRSMLNLQAQHGRLLRGILTSQTAQAR